MFGALGSDTGGSIRLPAALNGVCGLMPTYGRVSRYGAMARSWSLDHIGTLARSAADSALLLEVIAGHDPRDGNSVAIPVPKVSSALRQAIEALRIGVPRLPRRSSSRRLWRRHGPRAARSSKSLGAVLSARYAAGPRGDVPPLRDHRAQ